MMKSRSCDLTTANSDICLLGSTTVPSTCSMGMTENFNAMCAGLIFDAILLRKSKESCTRQGCGNCNV